MDARVNKTIALQCIIVIVAIVVFIGLIGISGPIFLSLLLKSKRLIFPK